MKKLVINNTRNKIRFLLNLIIVILYGFSSIYFSYIYSLIAFPLSIYLLVTGSDIENFYFFVALTPFAGVVTLFDRGVIFIYLWIATLKMLMKKSTKISTYLFSSFILLIALELINDFFYVSMGTFVNVVMPVIYFIVFINYINLKSYNHKKTMIYFIISVVVVIFITSISSGGLIQGIQSSTSMSEARFGESARKLGGSMAMPIYCLTIISVILSYFILNKMNLKNKIIVYFTIMITFFIGFLSISRVYLLGLGAIALCLVLSIPTKKFFTIIKLILALIVTSLIFIIYNTELINSIYEFFLMRSTSNGILSVAYDIRFKIYKDCFIYLSKNLKALILGLGINNYGKVGANEGYLFSMWAHNIYLDILMSYGVIGSFCFYYVCYRFYKKCKLFNKNVNINLINLMPVVTIAVAYMTGGTLNQLKTYIYILMFTLHIFYAEDTKINNKCK